MSRAIVRRILKRAVLALVAAVLVFAAPLAASGISHLTERPMHWSEARRDSAGIAPRPETTEEAVILVYAARTWGWRGAFGVHTWIAAKPKGARAYTRYEVIGWRLRRGGSAVVVGNGVPDSYWFGNPPELLREMRGAEVEPLIPRIEAAAASYPYAGEYTVWPGPNSNTFIAHIARAVPELRVDLPPTAIGKDYLPNGSIFAAAPSGTGYQVSLLGLLGLTVAREEGFELNFLGLGLGFDFAEPALRLPGIGRIGFGG